MYPSLYDSAMAKMTKLLTSASEWRGATAGGNTPKDHRSARFGLINASIATQPVLRPGRMFGDDVDYAHS